MTNVIKYYMSSGAWGDGKSICLWRNVGNQTSKIARFQSEEAARLFAEDFSFPLSDELKDRINQKNN